MIFCLICGVANRDGSRFCNACGRRVDGVVQCPDCGGPNPLGSRFCSQCGSTLGAQQLGSPPPQLALGEPAWGAPIGAAPVRDEEEAGWADATNLAKRPRRSLAGLEPLTPDDLGLFQSPPAATPTPARTALTPDASPFVGGIVRARSYAPGARAAPIAEGAQPAPDQNAARTLQRIVGLETDPAEGAA